jgi:hypothetical protein
MSDDLNKRIDNKLEDNCCDCDESKNPSSGVCPAPLEHMTNWRTEHTRIRLPEDNFAFQVETQKINPNDCTCDPIVESCCYNLNDIPDVVYADFFVDTTLGNAYPCLRPQEGRLGALHSYEMKYLNMSAGINYPCRDVRVFGRSGIVPFDIFYPTLNPNVIWFNQDAPLTAINKQPLKKILEKVGGFLAEDKRYVDKFTVELRRNRTFDSHALPQTISAVRHIYDVKENLNAEAYHYREYYYRENCAPTGVVWSRQPPLNLVKDIPPCEYTQLKTIDCVPKMVWEGECKTPGGRTIKVLYFCDGVDSATGANTFKTMIFHLDTIKNEWGTFKERDFWNIFEKFEPSYDSIDWWSWHEDRDWARFLLYDIWYDEYYLDPNQDYRVLQNYNYLSTIGYREWIVKDDETWTYYKNLSILCKNLYSEYCSKRGYYVPPQESVQLDAPFQATTVRQAAPFYMLDHHYPYNEGLDSLYDIRNAPCSKNILGTCEYETVLDNDWDDEYQALYPTWPAQNADADGFFYWHYEAKIKPRKGPYKYTRKDKYSSSLISNPSTLSDWKYEWPQSWTLATKRENLYDLFYSASRKTKYPLNKLLPNKAPLLLKLFGRWNCPYTTPTRYRDLSLVGKLAFPLYFFGDTGKYSQDANVEAVVYKPYYSPAFYKVQVRYSLKDKPVEEHPSTARLYCPKLPESFLETRDVPDEDRPAGFRREFVKQIADFPNGIYPKHLFVTVEKTLIKASGRNNRRLSYDADMSSGSPKWNTAHVFPSSPIVTEYLDNVGPSGGVPWFEPKKISSYYTDLFYRVGFVGALGTPEDLTLVYGEWRDPETFKKEYSRQYYTLEANRQYKDTTTFYDDLIVQMKVTSTDPNTPAGTITLSSFQESFTGNPIHRFTNQDLECPYIEFPLVTYKLCLDFGGIYGTDGCVYFPYISPIGEESKIDNDAESPTDVKHISYYGQFLLRKDIKAIITSHSPDWSNSGELSYSKRGYGDPHLGSYVTGNVINAIGVLGGKVFFRDGGNPNGFPKGYPGNREELYIYSEYKPNITDAFDCDRNELQGLFIEGDFPFVSIPFPFLSPGPEIQGTPGSVLYNNEEQGTNPQLHYNRRGVKNPIRFLGSYGNGSTCDSRQLDASYLALWDGRTDSVNSNEATMINFSTNINQESYDTFLEEKYDQFITNTVESSWEILPLYNSITGAISYVRRKVPNYFYCTDTYKTLGFMQQGVQANIDRYKDNFFVFEGTCSIDRDGPTMPFVNLKTHLEYYPSTEVVTLQFDDLSNAVVLGGDGTPNYYSVNRTNLDRTTVESFDQVRTLTEFVIPRYQYPHGFYFKCIVTA